MAKSVVSRQWDRHAVMEEMLLGVLRAYSRDIPGDVAEFGTMLAVSARGLATGITEAERIYREQKNHESPDQKRLHLFDSFEGLPAATAEPDLKHPRVVSGDWSEGTCQPFSPDKLKEKCSEYIDADRIDIHEGWFADTVPAIDKALKFAVVHVDCDLYSSSMDVLVPLLSGAHISEGALIYFDDFHCAASSRQLGERKAWMDVTRRFNVESFPSHPYGSTGQAFIIDSYDTQDRG